MGKVYLTCAGVGCLCAIALCLLVLRAQNLHDLTPYFSSIPIATYVVVGFVVGYFISWTELSTFSWWTDYRDIIGVTPKNTSYASAAAAQALYVALALFVLKTAIYDWSLSVSPREYLYVPKLIYTYIPCPFCDYWWMGIGAIPGAYWGIDRRAEERNELRALIAIKLGLIGAAVGVSTVSVIMGAWIGYYQTTHPAIPVELVPMPSFGIVIALMAGAITGAAIRIYWRFRKPRPKPSLETTAHEPPGIHNVIASVTEFNARLRIIFFHYFAILVIITAEIGLGYVFRDYLKIFRLPIWTIEHLAQGFTILIAVSVGVVFINMHAKRIHAAGYDDWPAVKNDTE
jgi:hypothetical protein